METDEPRARVEALLRCRWDEGLTPEQRAAHIAANKRAIDALPVLLRRVFVMRYLLKFRNEEIAERVGLTPAEIPRLIANALLSIRERALTLGGNGSPVR